MCVRALGELRRKRDGDEESERRGKGGESKVCCVGTLRGCAQAFEWKEEEMKRREDEVKRREDELRRREEQIDSQSKAREDEVWMLCEMIAEKLTRILSTVCACEDVS